MSLHAGFELEVGPALRAALLAAGVTGVEIAGMGRPYFATTFHKDKDGPMLGAMTKGHRERLLLVGKGVFLGPVRRKTGTRSIVFRARTVDGKTFDVRLAESGAEGDAIATRNAAAMGKLGPMVAFAEPVDVVCTPYGV